MFLEKTQLLWQKIKNRLFGSLPYRSYPLYIKNSPLSLRQKTIISLGVSIIGLVGTIYILLSNHLNKTYNSLEEDNVRLNVERLLAVYQKRLNELNLTNLYWSARDDTYQFVEHPTQDYIDNNLFINKGLSDQNKISFIAIINSSGKIVYGENYNLITGEKKPLPKSLQQYLDTNRHLLKHSSNISSYLDTVILPESPLMMVSRPIVPTQISGPIKGTLIVGRYLDDSVVQQLAKTTQLRVSWDSYTNVNKNFLSQLKDKKNILIKPQNQDIISGYTLLKNLAGNPVLLLQIEMPRKIYNQGQKSLSYLLIYLLLVGIFFAIIIQLLLDKLIHFGHYSSLVSQASEGIFLIDLEQKKFLETNNAFAQMLGYKIREIIGTTLYNIAVDNAQTIDQDLQQLCQSDKESTCQHQYCRQNGETIHVEITANLIDYNSGKAICVIVRDITERKKTETALQESEQRLFWQATHDYLTGLINRLEFERLLWISIREAQSENIQHILCYLDLDQFKIVNDSCGHSVGDQLLRQVTNILQSYVTNIDVLARLGGDEFAIIFSQCSMENAFTRAQNLLKSVQEFRFIWEEKIFAVGVSIGLAKIDSQTIDLATILSAADAACYAAKNRGRNRVHVYEADDQYLAKQRGQMQWAAKITQAIAENRFCLYYQSIVPLVKQLHEVEHYEVLLRLRDEQGQFISPTVFLPAAERYDMMHLIDRWVINTLFASQAENYQRAWRRCQEENYLCLFSVNLSGASINDDDLIDFLLDQLHLYQIPPQVICFEITETVAITNLRKASQLICELKKLGCRFALDDFGSGMSSFSYLKNLPVDYLKIDGEFVKDILDDPVDLAMIEAINNIGHLRGMKTVAEFVENEAIFDKLTKIGVDYGQGYFITKPIFLV